SVVVDAEQVDGCGDHVEVAVLDVLGEPVRCEVGAQVRRVSAAQHGIEEDPVLQAVDPPGGVHIGLRGRVDRLDREQVEGDPGVGGRRQLADGGQAEAVREQQVVHGGDGGGRLGAAG